MWPRIPLFAFVLSMSAAMANDSPLLSRLIEGLPEPLNQVATKPEHEVQVLYVEIEKTEDGPKFTKHGWHLNKESYFYPASTVKLPVALFALEKLAALSVPELDREATMLVPPYETPSTVAEDVRQIFLVSDNAAFNRLFAFVGAKTIRERMLGLGLRDSRIVHALGLDRAVSSEPITFLNASGEILYAESPSFIAIGEAGLNKPIPKGLGYIESGVLVGKPKDFSTKNVFGLVEQHRFLRQLFFPGEGGLELSPEDRKFAQTLMGQYPRECVETSDASIREKPDAYVKNFLGWKEPPIRDSLRCYNKSGQAYGYMIDNAYVVDTEQDVAFFLAAVIHVNANQIFNDDVYEYDTIGEPFMRALGKAIYEHERSRK